LEHYAILYKKYHATEKIQIRPFIDRLFKMRTTEDIAIVAEEFIISDPSFIITKTIVQILWISD
jgi:hypothetical protein